jgi:methylthioribulose-1-phosphate dehydratase
MTLTAAPIISAAQARAAIVELCRRFHGLGWVSGTGGGMSIRVGSRIFMAPSAVPKEMIEAEWIFELDDDGRVVEAPPPSLGLSLTQCAPLFLAAMKQRGAGAVIHSHSFNAVMATLVFDSDVTITQLEMLKGLAGVGYNDSHSIPIIDNTAHECDLTTTLSAAIDAHPHAHAVLVRRHGIYVWGEDWRAAKRHAESYDHLLQVAVAMRQAGLNPSIAGAP